MIIQNKGNHLTGYIPVTSEEDTSVFLDFGLIQLKEGGMFSGEAAKERVFLLIQGESVVELGSERYPVRRTSFLDENPVCFHLPPGVPLNITAQSSCEFACAALENDKNFEPHVYSQEECRTEVFGQGTLDDAALRIVRTVFDDSNAPFSNLVVGEVVNFPGRWSSYPPHSHVQPEIYHYRLVPEQGFGFCGQGEQANIVHDRDTAVIPGGVVHPQVAAPGYAMLM